MQRVARAWRGRVACALSFLFGGGSGQADFPGCLCEALFYTWYSVFSNVAFIANLRHLVEDGTACRNFLGSLCIIQVWRAAYRVPFVTRECAVCIAMILLFSQNKTKRPPRGPNCWGQTLMFLLRAVFYVSYVSRSKKARLAITLGSLSRDRCWGTLKPKFARCVPCAVSHACMCREYACMCRESRVHVPWVTRACAVWNAIKYLYIYIYIIKL